MCIAENGDCGEYTKKHIYEDSCYLLHFEIMMKEDGRAVCQEEGGDLLEYNTMRERNIIQGMYGQRKECFCQVLKGASLCQNEAGVKERVEFP